MMTPTKLHIKGPLAGRMWVCYIPLTNKIATGMSPEQAYNNWHSFHGNERGLHHED